MKTQPPPSFQFYPRDFISSRAVSSMTPEARGGYIMLLCHAWLSEEAGVLPDDDEILQALSSLGARWATCSASIRRAFTPRQRGEVRELVQERMVEERAAQRRRYETAAKGASVTNARRATSLAQRPQSDTLSERPAVAPSSSSSSSSSEKQKTGRSRARRRAVLEIPEALILSEATRTSLPVELVRQNAETIRREGAERGYSNFPLALARWNDRDVAKGHARRPNGEDQDARICRNTPEQEADFAAFVARQQAKP